CSRKRAEFHSLSTTRPCVVRYVATISAGNPHNQPRADSSRFLRRPSGRIPATAAADRLVLLPAIHLLVRALPPPRDTRTKPGEKSGEAFALPCRSNSKSAQPYGLRPESG